jgi:hypothetical protein
MTSLSKSQVQSEQVVRRTNAIVPNSSCHDLNEVQGDYELVQIRRGTTTPCSVLPTTGSFFSLPAVQRGMRTDPEIVAGKREEEKEKVSRGRHVISKPWKQRDKSGKVQKCALSVPASISGEYRATMRSLMNPNMHYNFRIVLNSQIVSTAGGVIDSTTMIIPMDPSGSIEWTSLAALFDEFRVLEIESHWQPRGRFHGPDGQYNGVATVFGLDNPMASGFDNDSLPTATTIDQVMTYTESHYGNTADPHTYKFRRPNITQSAYWVDCAVPSQSLGGVVVFAGLLNASVPYGQSLRVWHIQLRMRQ